MSPSAAPDRVTPEGSSSTIKELTATAGSSLHHRTLRCTRGFVAASEDSLQILRTRRGSRELAAGPEDSSPHQRVNRCSKDRSTRALAHVAPCRHKELIAEADLWMIHQRSLQDLRNLRRLRFRFRARGLVEEPEDVTRGLIAAQEGSSPHQGVHRRTRGLSLHKRAHRRTREPIAAPGSSSPHQRARRCTRV